jgi:hypothetical protein
VTTRNRVLETIREMLETLAGPVPVAEGLSIAVQSLRRGLQAHEVICGPYAHSGGRWCMIWFYGLLPVDEHVPG